MFPKSLAHCFGLVFCIGVILFVVGTAEAMTIDVRQDGTGDADGYTDC